MTQGAPGPSGALPGRYGDLASARWRILNSLILPITLPLFLLCGWWWTTAHAHWFNDSQLPTPDEVWLAARDLAQSGQLFHHVMASVERVACGFACGTALAVVIGVLVGSSRLAEQAIDPMMQSLRCIPSLAWVPFLLLWLGIDQTPKVTLIAIGAFFPIYVNLVAGIHAIDRRLLEVGSVFHFSRLEVIWRIRLPSAFPYLVTGMRIGLGQAWLFLVAAELIASSNGLGFLLIDGENSSRPDLMLVAIISLAILGLGTDRLLRLAETRLMSWSEAHGDRR
jgi:sulfonate transport system permease protein